MSGQQEKGEEEITPPRRVKRDGLRRGEGLEWDRWKPWIPGGGMIGMHIDDLSLFANGEREPGDRRQKDEEARFALSSMTSSVRGLRPYCEKVPLLLTFEKKEGMHCTQPQRRPPPPFCVYFIGGTEGDLLLWGGSIGSGEGIGRWDFFPRISWTGGNCEERARPHPALVARFAPQLS